MSKWKVNVSNLILIAETRIFCSCRRLNFSFLEIKEDVRVIRLTWSKTQEVEWIAQFARGEPREVNKKSLQERQTKQVWLIPRRMKHCQRASTMDPACHLIVMCMLRDMVSDSLFLFFCIFFVWKSVSREKLLVSCLKPSRRIVYFILRAMIESAWAQCMNNRVTVKSKKDSMNSTKVEGMTNNDSPWNDVKQKKRETRDSTCVSKSPPCSGAQDQSLKLLDNSLVPIAKIIFLCKQFQRSRRFNPELLIWRAPLSLKATAQSRVGVLCLFFIFQFRKADWDGWNTLKMERELNNNNFICSHCDQRRF